jgi:hypothetical protein
MFTHYKGSCILTILLGASCLSFTSGNQNNDSPSQPSIEGVRPGVSGEPSRSDQYQGQRSDRREIAQGNPIDKGNVEKGFFRMGDWDNKENWRYNRDEFYRGESQPQAYRENHPYGPGGVGYDGDENYYRNLRRYNELQGNPNAQSQFQQYSGYDYQGERQGQSSGPVSNYGEGSPNRAYEPRYSDGNYGNQNDSQPYYQDRSGRNNQNR